MLVVHPHLHPRRTGVTAHVEAVVTALGRLFDARTLGSSLSPALPRVSLREVLRRARREPVVWHAHRNNELLVGLLLRALTRRVHLVFTRHAAHRPGRYTRWLAGWAQERVALTRQVADAFGLPAEVIGHGVDLARFRPPERREAAWAQLGVGGRHGVGVVGRVRPAKGQGDFVAAVSPLLAGDALWRAILVGRAKGKDQAWAEGLRAATGGALVLAGEQADASPWLQGLSILVQPSLNESYSLVLLEAMAAGCCVVAARLPHYSAFIEHGRTGFFYEPGDVEGLRQRLRALMADPEHCARVGRAAAEEARARFSVEREAAALAALYEGVVGGR